MTKTAKTKPAKIPIERIERLIESYGMTGTRIKLHVQYYLLENR